MRTPIVGLACALLLAGASPAPAAVKNPDTFVMLTTSDPDSLDPAWCYDGGSHNIISNIYETLFTFDGPSLDPAALSPRLAAQVPTAANGLVSRDGLTYRIPIRKGVRFHDGSMLTPEDVRYSLLRFMLSDRPAGPASLLLEPVLGLGTTRPGGVLREDAYDLAAKAVTVDGDAVVIRLAKPFAPFPSVLSNYGAIVSKKWCAAHGQWDGRPETWKKYNNPSRPDMIPSTEANGTGPFKLERYDSVARQTVLARFDGYWRGPAKLARVYVKTVPEFATRKLMLSVGDADSIYETPINRPQFDGLTGVEVIDGLQMLKMGSMIGLNFKINPVANENIGSGKLDGNGIPPDFFADKDVREAFAYAIDYDAYLRDVLRGQAQRAVGVIPAGMLGHLERPPKYVFDLAKSAEHFRKAHGGKLWDKGFKLKTAVTAGADMNLAIMQILKRGVESVNPKFSIEIRQVQSSTALAEVRAHKLPAYLEGWTADYPDPHNFAFPYYDTDGYYPTQQGYSNHEIDRLIAAAAAESDPARRAALYIRLQDLAEDDLPVIGVSVDRSFRAQRSWIKGFVFKPTFPDMPYGSDYYDLSKAE